MEKEGRRNGVKKTFDSVQNTMKSGFHFTITYFWIQIVDYHVNSMTSKPSDFQNFWDLKKSQLADEHLYLKYYKAGTIESQQAAKEMVLPDKQQLPQMIPTKK